MASKSARGFHYQKRDKSAIKERANMQGGGYDTIIKPKYKVYKPKEGKNLIRILPPTWEKAAHYGYDIFVNYNIGIDNQSYLSLSKMKSEPDPLADARRDAERDGDEKLAKALRATQRICMWVIDRMDEDEGPQVYPAAFSVDKEIANLTLEEDTKEVLYIDDPENGQDVRFYREGTNLNTDYVKFKLMPPSPIHEDEKLQNEWLEMIAENSLPECLQFYSYEHIAQVFNGKSKTGPDEGDEDEKPSRRRPTARKPADEDAEPEEDKKPSRGRISNTDDEEDADEKPKRPRSRLKDKEEPVEETARTSIRERLKNRGKARTEPEEEPEEEDD